MRGRAKAILIEKFTVLSDAIYEKNKKNEAFLQTENDFIDLFSNIEFLESDPNKKSPIDLAMEFSGKSETLYFRLWTAIEKKIDQSIPLSSNEMSVAGAYFEDFLADKVEKKQSISQEFYDKCLKLGVTDFSGAVFQEGRMLLQQEIIRNALSKIINLKLEYEARSKNSDRAYHHNSIFSKTFGFSASQKLAAVNQILQFSLKDIIQMPESGRGFLGVSKLLPAAQQGQLGKYVKTIINAHKQIAKANKTHTPKM